MGNVSTRFLGRFFAIFLLIKDSKDCLYPLKLQVSLGGMMNTKENMICLGILQIPLYGRILTKKHPKFAAGSRIIHLAFATDGFNPYRTMNVSYSIWPGILIPFSFPPFMCMKDSNFILSVLILDRSPAGTDMDVYFQPLVYDLLDMFVNGVRTYEASKGEYF
jgi:hypothetical protein